MHLGVFDEKPICSSSRDGGITHKIWESCVQITGWAKNGLFLEVCNSRICWHWI